MLDQIRKGAGSWVAKIFIGVLVLSFAVWGISDIFSGRRGTTLAEVGDQQISAEEFQEAFRREISAASQRLGRPITVDQARDFQLDNQVLGRLISEAALDDQIVRLNLGIPDEVIAESITANPLFQGADNRFNRTRFEQLLASNGLTEAAYVALERRNMLRSQMVGVVADSLSVPETLTEAIHKHQNEKRTIVYFVLTADKVAGVGEPDEAQRKAYYEKNRSRYTAPEYRKLVLLRLQPRDLAENVHVSADEIRKAYERRAEEFVTPERREVEQIVFPTLEEATEARDRIVKGQADFLSIAKERGFSSSDMNLGKVAKKDIPDKVIADAVFNLDSGEISVPISGSLSIVLLRVKSIEPEVRREFAQVKDELREQLAVEKAQEEILNLHDVVEDERAGGATLPEIAKRLDLPLIEIEAVDSEGRDPAGNKIEAIPDPADVLRLAFESDVGVETDPVDTDKQGFVWVDVAGVTPSTVRPLDKVEKQVVEDWKRDRRRALLSDKAKELVSRIEAGEQIAAVAQTVDATLTRSKPMRRRDTDGDFTAEALDKVFSVPGGGLATHVAKDGASAMIMRVDEVTAPTFTAGAGDVKALANHLQRGLKDDLLQQYLAGLRNISGVTVNNAVWRVLRGESS